jgi:zinc protease
MNIRNMVAAALVVAIPAAPVGAQKTSSAGTVAASRADLAKGITTTTLKNGMKIIVWPDTDIPNVAMYTWYRVGSRNEVPGITGLSHFFEHMMFNGAKKYGAGEFDRVMEANGGSNNAYTSDDVTVYQNWFPRSALELIFDLEADRISNLSIDPKIVESERGVVYSERRSSVDNDNSGMLFEQVQAAAFTAHPYGIPVIGWPADIESWTQADLESFFKTYYAPNNATMLVVGDVTAKEVFTLAEKYLAPIPAAGPPPAVRTKEPEQQGERRVTVRKAAQVPLLQMAYHIGAASDPDAEAVQLMMAVLTRGDSSRLHQRLVEKERLAIDVGSFRHEGFDPGLAWFFVTLSGDADPSAAEAIVDEEILRLTNDGPTDAELRKVKNGASADFWRALQTISGKAQALGQYETLRGGYAGLFAAPEKYESVTREQIQNVARKYFQKRNRTVGILLPEESEPAKETR